ncbi:MAG TPA: aminopeptidase N, partial [Bdellovibrionales bacterium]|nr:aminopeptidase N [Bdellovibrionales bacterium]
MRRLILALSAFISLSCTQPQKQAEAPAGPVFKPRAATKGLSLEHAAERSLRVSNVDYTLAFQIGEGDDFGGQAAISFDLKHKSHPLTIDFNDGRVTKLKINGQDAPIVYNGMFLTLEPALLVEGANSVEIAFTHPYSKSGSGLYKFTDPEDKRVYLYTDFEPYDSNLLFPQFDQPDLKAAFTMTVEAPADWIVVSSVRESAVKDNSKVKTWSFPKSARFSTYLFSLHAGHYKVWESKAGDIPLRLFARQSLAKYVQPEEWFTVTKQGFEFFNEYFDYEYPFVKYDQLIVPDFNAGAMENVGAVTFSERFVQRGKSTAEERERRANTLLHEMAHMWFGNLVTMKWWNDLWLNESFATVMAYIAAQEATEFKKSWQSFFTGTKQWAYWEDQLVTTHPIVTHVPDTTQAFVNFDGITYGKGASALKQLSFLLGAKEFRNGVRKYFKKYEFANAEMADFIRALEDGSGRELGGWTAEWLNTSGLNTVEARFECKADKITAFRLVQSAPQAYPTVRTHKTQIGLYGPVGDKVKELRVVPVTYSGADTNVSVLVGQPCPLLVYPNHDDYDYVKVSLDGNTIRAAQTSLAKIDDPLVRIMFWQTLWDMVRDQQLHLTAYAGLVLENAKSEKELKNLKFVLDTLVGRWNNDASVMYYMNEGTEKAKLAARIENFIWSGLERAEIGSDFQKLWFDSYVKVARTKAAQANLTQMLDDKIQFSGLELDQDRRWNTLYALSAHGAAGTAARIKKELTRDPSEKGQQAAIAAEAASPDQSTKRKWFSTIAAPKTSLSLARLRSAMRGMFPTHQTSLRFSFKDEFFDKLLKLAPVKENEFLTTFAEHLAPMGCTE